MACEWKTYRLDELCEFINGFAFKSTDYVAPSNDTIEVFRMGYIQRGGGFKQDDTPVFVPRIYGRSLEKFLLNPGDVTIAMTDMKDRVAILGNTAWISEAERFVINQRVGCIRVKRLDLLEPRFLYFYSNWAPHVEHLRSKANSGVQVNLSTTAIKESKLKIPPIREQKAIAGVLGILDDKIELNRRMNETLEAIAQALFKSWFVDFDPLRVLSGQMPEKPPFLCAKPLKKAGFPDRFQGSEFGEIPEGWRVAKIRELSNHIQYGLTQSASIEPIGPRFLRITDVQGGRVDWSMVPYCRVSPEEHERYRLKPGDVLVARTGASTGENIYLPVVPDAVFASYLVRFQFADSAIARLVGAFMRTADYFDFVAGSIGGSAQPNASAQVLAGAELVLPTPEIARRFAEIVDPIDRRIAANCDESCTLASLRDALLPKLLSGELRPNETEKFVDVVK